MPNKYLDSVGLAEYTGLVKTALDTKLSLSGGTMTGTINMNDRALNLGTGNGADGRIYNISNLLRLTGGSNTSTGSYIDIGSSSATVKGIVLAASNGNGNIKKLQALSDGYLKWDSHFVLGGGIYKTVDTDVLSLNGGSNGQSGAYLNLYGKSHASSAGAFSLSAFDGTTRKQLVGFVDGTLTWCGYEIALSKNFLPLSGGTMTGNIVADKQFFEMTNSTLNGRNSIYGGTSGSTGAFLYVYGKNHTSLAGNFVLHANDGTNTSELIGKPDGTLTWKGLDIAPQKWATATFADTSVASGTRTNLGSFTLTKGTWLICIAVNFPNNANGYRDINMSSSSGGTQIDRYRYYRCAPTNGSDTHITWTIFDTASANITRYVNVLQNSGSALTVGGGYIAFRLSNDV